MKDNEKTASVGALDSLVRHSRAEADDNRRRALHNVRAETQNIRPYRNEALCALIDGIDRVLAPNAGNERRL